MSRISRLFLSLWGDGNWTQFISLKLFGTPRVSRQKSRDIPPKSLVPWVSKDIPNFLAPTPSREDPHPTRRYPDQKVWVWVPFPSSISLVLFSQDFDDMAVMNQKNPRVRKICVRNSGAGNARVNFMDAWKKCALSAGKTHVHKVPRFGGGGVIWVFLGGGSADFIFMGARIFLNEVPCFFFFLAGFHLLLTGEKSREKGVREARC